MHLDYIRSFCRVVKVKSITKAAGELHLSQPALSLQINCLESRFGTRLLVRTNRGVKLTPSGEMVYRYAQRMLGILDSLDQELRDIRNPAGVKLSIAASPIPGNYILPVQLMDFSRKNPGQEFTVAVKSVAQVIENLMDRTANIGIIASPLTPEVLKSLKAEKITALLLGNDTIVPVCRRGGPWSNKQYELAHLPGLPMIIPNRTCGCRAAIETGLRSIHLVPEVMNVVMELDNCTAIISAIKANAGISLIPCLTFTDTPDLEILNIPSLSFPLQIYLLVSSALERAPGVRELASFLACTIEDGKVT